MIKSHLKFLLAVPAGWLLKLLEVSALALCLVVGMYDPASGRDFHVSTQIKPDSLTVGDKALFINIIDVDSNYDIKPAPVEGQLGDATVLSDIYSIPDSEQGTMAFACTLAVYKPGISKIPSFVFNITDSLGNVERVSGDSLAVTVYSVLPADTSGVDIADIKEPMKLRGPIWPYLLIPLGIVVIAISIFLFSKYYRRKFEMPVVPPRPPWEIAYENLDRLKAERDLEFGRLKKFYFELTLIIREYLEGRYDFPAAEYTTYELENTEELKEIERDLYEELFATLNRADLAKFAKFLPEPADAESDLKFAYELVSKTIPVVKTDETEEKKLEVAAK
jgi:hypothetical protein